MKFIVSHFYLISSYISDLKISLYLRRCPYTVNPRCHNTTGYMQPLCFHRDLSFFCSFCFHFVISRYQHGSLQQRQKPSRACEHFQQPGCRLQGEANGQDVVGPGEDCVGAVQGLRPLRPPPNQQQMPLLLHSDCQLPLTGDM